MTGFSIPSPPPEEMKCDFCSSKPVRWAYPARPHVMGQLPSLGFEARSPDDWAACEPCHQIIQLADRDRLSRRSAKRYARIYGGTWQSHYKLLREVHDNFWAAREGAPEPHEVTT